MPLFSLKRLMFINLIIASPLCLANTIIPLNHSDNKLYYKLGGGSDFILPPFNNTQPIHFNAGANLNLGLSCQQFNPALSISNSINDLKNDATNLPQALVAAATGSLAAMPMYMLAKANPNAYHYLNNAILSANKRIALSVKNCERAQADIRQGKNPYTDWATLSVGDDWQQHLSLTASGNEDLNDAEKSIDQHHGDHGVNWVQGSKNNQGLLHAGGLNQPPIHVIADTMIAGFNAFLQRDLNDHAPAALDSEIANVFATPEDAANWVTFVVGDQSITTCNDAHCKNNQASSAGHGLAALLLQCEGKINHDCETTVRDQLAQLVTGTLPVTKDNLLAVSGNDLMITPEIISVLRHSNTTQQQLLITKLAEEVATQRVFEKALLARQLLRIGSQVPIILANLPAQKIIQHAIDQLTHAMHSINDEAMLRKQVMSQTFTHILNYQQTQQHQLHNVEVSPTLMNDSALSNQDKTP